MTRVQPGRRAEPHMLHARTHHQSQAIWHYLHFGPMNPPGRVERQRTYLAYRELFSGNNAFVRQKKVILSMIKASKTGMAFTNKHLKQKTVPIVRSLLKDRVFELEELARNEFPELWGKSPQDQAFSVAFIQDAAAPEGLVTYQRAEHEVDAESLPHASRNGAGRNALNDTGKNSLCLNLSVPRLSYNTQHYIMATVQRILEAACFNFTKTWLPSVLDERGWSCAAALELTCWIQIMKTDMGSLPDVCIDQAGRAIFRQISRHLAQLRHTAVHRIHLGSEKVLDYIRSAHMLTEILRDNESASKLQTVHSCLEGIISKTKHNMIAMQLAVNNASLAIQKQREALDRQEQQLREVAGKRLSKIAEAADESLISCVDSLTDIGGTAKKGSNNEIPQASKAGNHNDSTLVDEDFIESDEDQLREELE